jgi:hypothetical protein
VRYDAILAPGTNPNSVVLNYQGANNLRIGPDGTLMYDTVLGTVKEQKLFVYQDVNGVRQPVEAAFRLVGKNKVGFALGKFDVSKPLTIDPQILAAWTYFGGSANDQPTAISTHNGHIVVSGRTLSNPFPTTVGAYDTTYAGTGEFFVSRLRQSLTTNALVYSTYIGGAGNESDTSFNGYGATAKVMPNGDVVFGGTTTSTGLFTSVGALQSGAQTNTSGYILRLNGTLGTPKAGTYFDGGSTDEIWDLEVNPNNGDVLIALQTGSRNLGTGTDGSFAARNYAVGGSATTVKPDPGNGTDIFIAVLNQNLGAVKMGTYYGGTGVDRPNAVSYGRDFQTVVLGATSASSNIPVTFGGTTTSRTGVVARFRLGNGIQNGARLASIGFGVTGGNVDLRDLTVDLVNDRPIAVGSTGAAFNSTNWSSIAAGAPGYQQTFQGTSSTRGFIVRFTPELNRVSGWTLVGGSGNSQSDVGRAVAVQSNGTIHYGGWSSSDNFPIVSPGGTNLNNTLHTSTKAALVRISNGFALIGASVIGGTGVSQSITALTLDGPYNDLFFTGTSAGNFDAPTIAGYTPYDTTHNGSVDTIVGRFAFSTDPLIIDTSVSSLASGSPVSARVTLNAPVTAAAGQNVTFTVSNLSALKFPGGVSSFTVNIPQGARRGSVKLLALPVAMPTPVTIKANSSGTSLTTEVTVNP